MIKTLRDIPKIFLNFFKNFSL